MRISKVKQNGAAIIDRGEGLSLQYNTEPEGVCGRPQAPRSCCAAIIGPRHG
jgi:hypothetical protein